MLLLALSLLSGAHGLIYNPIAPTLKRMAWHTPIVPLLTAPTLREQMQAYIKSVKERGMELTPEQKEMIAEFEADEELLQEKHQAQLYLQLLSLLLKLKQQ